jgi:hypothetical protein
LVELDEMLKQYEESFGTSAGELQSYEQARRDLEVSVQKGCFSGIV